MTDILEEVKQDYRDWRNAILFKKLLMFTMVVTALIIVVMSVSSWHYNNKIKDLESRTSLLHQTFAAKDLDTDLLIESLLSLTDKNDAISEASTLRLAKLKADSGKVKESIIMLDKLISSTKNIVIKNMSKILHISIILDDTSISPDDMHKLDSYFVSIDKKQPLYPIAQIYSSLFKMKNGNLSAAEDIMIRLLQDQEISISTRQIATKILNQIKWKH